MSLSPTNRSADLQQLRREGYEISIEAGHLVLAGVPYVTRAKEVKRGKLVSTLQLNGDVTVRPDTHVVHFAGEEPCLANGTPYAKLIHSSATTDLGKGLVVNFSFSQKPPSGHYENYYEKMTTYAAMLTAQAQAHDAAATAKTFIAVPSEGDEDSVFHYMDTASPRAQIGAASATLAGQKIGIVGLGGTGAYVLDFVAKCPVAEIHLFDGDKFHQHSAFRAPGAASLEELRANEHKAVRFAQKYSRMHRHVIAHPEFVNEANVQTLCGLDFVFVCVDKGSAKKIIFEALEAAKVGFVDCGLGVLHADEGRLQGHVRTTASTEKKRDHLRSRVSLADTEEGAYAQNIQIAELNALAATLAVLKWKKLRGFYVDLDGEHTSTFAISGSALLNEDHA